MKNDHSPQQVRYLLEIPAKLALVAAKQSLEAQAAAKKRRAVQERKAAEFTAMWADIIMEATRKGQSALPEGVLKAMVEADEANRKAASRNKSTDPQGGKNCSARQNTEGTPPSERKEKEEMERKASPRPEGSAVEGPRTLLTKIPHQKLNPQQIEMFVQFQSFLPSSKELSSKQGSSKFRFRERRIKAAFGELRLAPPLAHQIKTELDRKKVGRLLLEVVPRIIDCEGDDKFEIGMKELLVIMRRLYIGFPEDVKREIENAVSNKDVTGDVQLVLFAGKEVK